MTFEQTVAAEALPLKGWKVSVFEGTTDGPPARAVAGGGPALRPAPVHILGLRMSPTAGGKDYELSMALERGNRAMCESMLLHALRRVVADGGPGR